jgi:hypothetical protein
MLPHGGDGFGQVAVIPAGHLEEIAVGHRRDLRLEFQSSSASRSAAGLSGFLTFTQPSNWPAT